MEFLTPTALAGIKAEYRRLNRSRESQRQSREARDWVNAVGYYVYEVVLGQVDDHEKDFEELEYMPDVTYRVFKLACGVAAGGREEGGAVGVREEQSALHQFLPGDACDDGDEDEDDEGRLTEYFTSHLINASPHPIRDLMGNALYNSESDLVSALLTLVYSPSPP